MDHSNEVRVTMWLMFSYKIQERIVAPRKPGNKGAIIPPVDSVGFERTKASRRLMEPRSVIAIYLKPKFRGRCTGRS
jgi:hypothetical protein